MVAMIHNHNTETLTMKYIRKHEGERMSAVSEMKTERKYGYVKVNVSKIAIYLNKMHWFSFVLIAIKNIELLLKFYV